MVLNTTNSTGRNTMEKKDLLVQPLPYNIDPRLDRTDIPLLRTNYSTYSRAHAQLVLDWLHGKVGAGAPKDQADRERICIVNDIPVGACEALPSEEVGESGELKADIGQCALDDETRAVYDELIERNVPKLLQVATSHRQWIRKTYEFFKLIGVKFSDRMEYLVCIHDLTKYTDREVLGYAVMFGGGQNGFRKLEDEDEKAEWDLAVEHHYISNPHHPEYFYPRLADGSRDKSRAMPDIDPENGQEYLDESLIDMLASKGERVMKDDEEFSVGKWMDIQERFMARYGQQDKEYVLQLAADWRKMALEFLETDENRSRTHGHFDDRAVVM